MQSELTRVKCRNKLHKRRHGGITSQQVMEYQLVFTCSRNVNNYIYGSLQEVKNKCNRIISNDCRTKTKSQTKASNQSEIEKARETYNWCQVRENEGKTTESRLVLVLLLTG